MFPMASLNVKDLYDTTVEFLALRSPTFSGRQSPTSPREAAYPIAEDDPEGTPARQSPTIPGMTLGSVKRELEDTRKELTRSKLEVVRLKDRCRELEKALEESQQLLMEQSRSSSTNTDDSREGRSIQSGVPYRYSYVEEEGAEASITKVFMTKTDLWSGAQVVQAVQDLNSEILQFSAAASELCTFEPRSQTPRYAQALQDTTTRLGQALVTILSKREHSQDPILVQLAIQGAVTSCMARAMSSFCMGLPAKHDGILGQIYGHMYAAAPQPISAKWRSLTHRFIHVLYPYLANFTVKELEESIYRWCFDIFVICGCNVTQKSSLLSKEGMRGRFGDQVRRIADTVFKLVRITKEEIMSTSFDITAVRSGEEYDSSKMKDTFHDYGSSTGVVLMTVEFGLRCATGRESPGGRTAVESRHLIYPKVVLDTVLDTIDS